MWKEELNSLRSQYGLHGLTEIVELDELAYWHSNWMAENEFTHSYWNVYENILFCDCDGVQAIRQWMTSKPHLQNMLADARWVGYSCDGYDGLMHTLMIL